MPDQPLTFLNYPYLKQPPLISLSSNIFSNLTLSKLPIITSSDPSTVPNHLLTIPMMQVPYPALQSSIKSPSNLPLASLSTIPQHLFANYRSDKTSQFKDDCNPLWYSIFPRPSLAPDGTLSLVKCIYSVKSKPEFRSKIQPWDLDWQIQCQVLYTCRYKHRLNSYKKQLFCRSQLEIHRYGYCMENV